MHGKNEEEKKLATVPQTPPRRVIIDIDGDLILKCGANVDEDEEELLVTSRALRRVSPVWKKMLFGKFRESEPAEGEWIVALPEDKPSPMLIVMNIVHTRFHEVPRKPKLNQIYEVLVLADKYDVTKVIGPWAKDWLGVAEATCKTRDTKGKQAIMATYVAWQLGDQFLYQNVVQTMTINCAVDDDDNLMLSDGNSLSSCHHLGSPDLLSRISSIRANAIGDLLDAVHEITGSLLDGTARHDADANVGNCTRSTLGGFWYGMVKERGAMLPKEAKLIRESLDQLIQSVSKILYWALPFVENSIQTCDHTSKLRNMLVLMPKVLPTNPTEAEKRSMEKQRRMVGLDIDWTSCKVIRYQGNRYDA